MINWFKRISEHYENGRYDNSEVKIFVECGKITPDEYKKITGEDYIK